MMPGGVAAAEGGEHDKISGHWAVLAYWIAAALAVTLSANAFTIDRPMVFSSMRSSVVVSPPRGSILTHGRRWRGEKKAPVVAGAKRGPP
jgi:hypothetical protein